MSIDSDVLSRAQGCLLGQLAGDSLGSLVEFWSPEEIRKQYPLGVRDLADGGTWGTIAGQPTDDSEMALLLARMLVAHGAYDPTEAQKAYVFWLESDPFDCGSTILSGLRGHPNPQSQANGALMRISPLGVFGAFCSAESVAMWAREDALITHPHPVCQQANALFTLAISEAVREATNPRALYGRMVMWASEMEVDESLMQRILLAKDHPPADYIRQQGWVLTAFQNSLWQMLHALNLEEALVDTIMRGGDTDTNAAICGALLGALYGKQALPRRWVVSLERCRPRAGLPDVHRPRPEVFWPIDALDLAEKLLTRGRAHCA